MAKLLETFRSSVLDSVKGRKLGLDKDGYLVGVPGVPGVITDVTTASTGTALPNYGSVKIQSTTLGTSSAGAVFLLSNPVVGVDVTFYNAYTSTGGSGSTAMTLLRPSTAFYIVSSEGSTMTTIVMSSQGYVTLRGLSTDAYYVTSRVGTSMVSLNGTT